MAWDGLKIEILVFSKKVSMLLFKDQIKRLRLLSNVPAPRYPLTLIWSVPKSDSLKKCKVLTLYFSLAYQKKVLEIKMTIEKNPILTPYSIVSSPLFSRKNPVLKIEILIYKRLRYPVECPRPPRYLSTLIRFDPFSTIPLLANSSRNAL